MFKSIVLFCVIYSVVVEARPKWQFLPAVPGYVPVYIRTGDTPLEEINPELAEAFHVMPAGRSVNKQIEASPDSVEHTEPQKTELPEDIIDHRPYEKKIEKKKKATEVKSERA